MTDKKKLASRIPFENLEKDSAVSAWSLPSMDTKLKRFYSAKREQQTKKTSPAGKESVENYTSHVKPKPLTAQDLQKLAAEAKQEGFDTGYQEGLQKALQEGRERGEKEGEKKAYEETRKQLQDEITRLALISDNLFNPMEKQARELENIIVDMVLRFTQELIAKEISETPSYLVATVRNALMALPAGAQNITVFCNDSDTALLEKYCPADNRNWAVKTDSTIASGGCRIETLESLVDYTVAHRLDAFLQQVRDRGEIDPSDVERLEDHAAEYDKRRPSERQEAPEDAEDMPPLAADRTSDESAVGTEKSAAQAEPLQSKGAQDDAKPARD